MWQSSDSAVDDEKLKSELQRLKKQELAIRKSALGEKRAEDEEKKSSPKALRYSWLGVEFAAIFFTFVYASNYADQRLGTKPWLVLVGIIAGFALALYRLIFVARRLSE